MKSETKTEVKQLQTGLTVSSCSAVISWLKYNQCWSLTCPRFDEEGDRQCPHQTADGKDGHRDGLEQSDHSVSSRLIIAIDPHLIEECLYVLQERETDRSM